MLTLWLFLCFFPCAPITSSRAEENKIEPKEIYLTFDDGPSDRVTPKILTVLEEKKVKATFFLIGRNAERRPLLTRRIMDEGHSVGIHTYSHEYSHIYSSPFVLLSEIEKCGEVLERLGISTRLFRFPGGEQMAGKEFKTEVQKAGYRVIGWNALSSDGEKPQKTAEELLSYALQTAGEKKRIILLLHDSTTKEETAKMLPALIDEFSARGYKFCSFPME